MSYRLYCQIKEPIFRPLSAESLAVLGLVSFLWPHTLVLNVRVNNLSVVDTHRIG